LVKKIDLKKKLIYKMEHQDWTPVVLKKTHNGGKKMPNKPQITEEDDYNKPIQISAQNSKLIQGGRNLKKMTQKDLAKAINKDVGTIQLYESGKITPDFRIMSAIERVLGIKLNKKKKQ